MKSGKICKKCNSSEQIVNAKSIADAPDILLISTV